MHWRKKLEHVPNKRRSNNKPDFQKNNELSYSVFGERIGTQLDSNNILPKTTGILEVVTLVDMQNSSATPNHYKWQEGGEHAGYPKIMIDWYTLHFGEKHAILWATNVLDKPSCEVNPLRLQLLMLSFGHYQFVHFDSQNLWFWKSIICSVPAKKEYRNFQWNSSQISQPPGWVSPCILRIFWIWSRVAQLTCPASHSYCSRTSMTTAHRSKDIKGRFFFVVRDFYLPGFWANSWAKISGRTAKIHFLLGGW